MCTSWWETVWWLKLNLLGLSPKCSKDQWDCEIVDCYIALPLQQWNFASLLKYSCIGVSLNVLNKVTLVPTSPRKSWEGGVWGRDWASTTSHFYHNVGFCVLMRHECLCNSTWISKEVKEEPAQWNLPKAHFRYVTCTHFNWDDLKVFLHNSFS